MKSGTQSAPFLDKSEGRRPAGWGQDSLSDFLEYAHSNVLASFVKLPKEYKRLAEIDAIFVKLLENLNNTPSWFQAFFVGRSHSCIRAAALHALSGQFVETYLCLRGALENALYGLYLDSKPEIAETWLNRKDGEAQRKACCREFVWHRRRHHLPDIIGQPFPAQTRSIHANYKAWFSKSRYWSFCYALLEVQEERKFRIRFMDWLP